VERHVVVGGFDPIDLVCVDHHRFATDRHEKARARGGSIGEKLGEPLVDFAAMVGASALLGVLERREKSGVLPRVSTNSRVRARRTPEAHSDRRPVTKTTAGTVSGPKSSRSRKPSTSGI
jgi:hypothetical protein